MTIFINIEKIDVKPFRNDIHIIGEYDESLKFFNLNEKFI